MLDKGQDITFTHCSANMESERDVFRSTYFAPHATEYAKNIYKSV